ncbi:MAG TPA: hypothetical protein VN541_14005 [Tepidisphaeraceae bacterium]|nr:hypothetical protein [Tepidisphaeraceae bacterium]
MPFTQDVSFAGEMGQTFGKYHSTFRSKTGQVLAQLFEQNGRLVAHVSFAADLKPEDVTDGYVGELNRYASDHGFSGKLRIIYSE